MTTQARARNLFAQIDDAPRSTPTPRPARPARTRGQVRQIVETAAQRIGATVRESDLGFSVQLGNSRVDVTNRGEVLAPNYILDIRETIEALESARDEIRAARLAPVEAPKPTPSAPLEVRHSGEDHPIVGEAADAITAAIASVNPSQRSWSVRWKKTGVYQYEAATCSAGVGRGYITIDLRLGVALASEQADEETRAAAAAIQGWLSQRSQEAA